MLYPVNRLFLCFLFFIIFSCKTTKKEAPQTTSSGAPFAHPAQFFNGAYNRFETTYIFSDSKNYEYIWKDKTGAFIEEGSFTVDENQKLLHLKPSLVRCAKDQKIASLDMQTFKTILDKQRLALMDAYERRATDPDGLNDLLKKLQDAKTDNEKTALSQELAKDMEEKNITKMEDFLKMIKGLRVRIEEEYDKIAKNQEIIDKNQKRIDMILQEKIENKQDKSAIAALNQEKTDLQSNQEVKKAAVQASIDEIDHINKKIKTLLEEYPLSEADLKEALGHLKNIDDYLQYTKERAGSLQAQEASLLDLIKSNQEVLERLKNFPSSLENSRSYFFEINQVKLFLDNQKINPASTGFNFMGSSRSAEAVASCDQSALIFLTKYLENTPR